MIDRIEFLQRKQCICTLANHNWPIKTHQISYVYLTPYRKVLHPSLLIEKLCIVWTINFLSFLWVLKFTACAHYIKRDAFEAEGKQTILCLIPDEELSSKRCYL